MGPIPFMFSHPPEIGQFLLLFSIGLSLHFSDSALLHPHGGAKVHRTETVDRSAQRLVGKMVYLYL